MDCLVVENVVGGVVESQDDVLGTTLFVIHKKIGETRTIWNEGGINPRRRNGILLQRIGALCQRNDWKPSSGYDTKIYHVGT